MKAASQRLLQLTSEICERDDCDWPLATLALRAGCSESHLQRSFTQFAGESPKRYAQRIRLDRAAVRLVTTDLTVLEIALGAGFASHEVFTRAFKRRFEQTPRAFRDNLRLPDGQGSACRNVALAVSPCTGLYRVSLKQRRENKNVPTSAIERRELTNEQPILFIRRRTTFDQLQQTMGECFGALYGYGQKAGLAIAGHPISRYISTGTGLWTVDCVMPLLAAADPNGEMEAGVLSAGPVAFAVHKGAYDRLSDTYAAIETWMEDRGYRTGGPPWESYVTDPGQTPNVDDWRTEVFWPLES